MDIIEKNKQRYANMDLLRIFSMLLIVLFHTVIHGGVLEAADSSSVAINIWVRFTYMLSLVCVNCYVLISGYFLAKSRFRLQKLMALWLEVVFYSFTIKLIFMLFGHTPFSFSSLISCLLPVFTGRYWFITIYFGMYLLFPFFNIAINAMNKKQHTILNIILFLLFSVMISVHPLFMGMNTGGGWSLAWFAVLYFAAAWFRLYFSPKRKMLPLFIWFGLSIIMALGYVFIGNRIPLIQTASGNLFRYDSVAAYICSLCVFSCFISIRIKVKWVKRISFFIAPATLGVYLIHDHADFSVWMWDYLNLPKYMDSAWFPVIQIGVVLMIFVVCVVTDLLRKYTIGRIEKARIVFLIDERVTRLFNNTLEKSISKIKNGIGE